MPRMGQFVRRMRKNERRIGNRRAAALRHQRCEQIALENQARLRAQYGVKG